MLVSINNRTQIKIWHQKISRIPKNNLISTRKRQVIRDSRAKQLIIKIEHIRITYKLLNNLQTEVIIIKTSKIKINKTDKTTMVLLILRTLYIISTWRRLSNYISNRSSSKWWCSRIQEILGQQETKVTLAWILINN